MCEATVRMKSVPSEDESKASRYDFLALVMKRMLLYMRKGQSVVRTRIRANLGPESGPMRARVRSLCGKQSVVRERFRP